VTKRMFTSEQLLGIAEALLTRSAWRCCRANIGETTPGIARLSPPLPELEASVDCRASRSKEDLEVGAFLDFCEAEMVSGVPQYAIRLLRGSALKPSTYFIARYTVFSCGA